MSLGRRSPLVALVLFSAFVLVVTAVCPRGMLRALAASELEASPAPAGLAIHETPDTQEHRLPGVRVAIAREDEDTGSVPSGAELAVAAGEIPAADTPSWGGVSADDRQHEDAPPARPGCERAPPSAA